MSNQLAVYNSFAFGELTAEDVSTVRETIGKECNESQFKLFMAIAKSANANPVLGEIHPSVFQGKLTVQFGIDMYVRKAKEFSDYGGYDVQLVHDNDEFKMHQERGDDGRYYIVIDEHSFGFPRGKVKGGYALAYRKGFAPFSVIMDIDEVEHYKKSQIGMQQRMWTSQFVDMFKKHMVKRALKAAFGLNFENEERETVSSNVENIEPYQRVDVTPPSEPVQTSNKPEQMNTPPKKETAPQQPTEAEKMKVINEQIQANFFKLGIEDNQIAAYIQGHFPQLEAGKKLTYQQKVTLVKIMESEIELKSELAEELE